MVDFNLGTLVLPAALVFAAPSTLGSLERGLFCNSIALVEQVVALADRGSNAAEAVTDVNHLLGGKACLYSARSEIRARTVRFERIIAANRSVYAIYRVDVTGFAAEKTEIGDIVWTLPQPLAMYTLRQAWSDQGRSH